MSVHPASGATPWAKTPDAVGSHLLSFSGETNYALVSRRFKTFHDQAQTRTNYNRVKELYTAQVLFPEVVAKENVSARDFADLNQRARRLFSLLPKGEEEYRRLDREFGHVDKTLSLERFEALSDTLARLVVAVPPSNGVQSTKEAKVCTGIGLLCAGAFVASLLLFLVFPVVVLAPFLTLTLLLRAGRNVRDYWNNQSFNLVNTALGGHLAEIQQRLSPTAGA